MAGSETSVNVGLPEKHSIETETSITNELKYNERTINPSLNLESFNFLPEETILDIDQPQSISTEVSPSSSENEFADVQFDRYMYINLLQAYDTQYNQEKLKNTFLQKKLTDYYKKRKMFYALKESSTEAESQKKYEKYLDKLESTANFYTTECTRTANEYKNLKTKRKNEQEKVGRLFDELQQLELNVGKNVIFNNSQGNLDRILEKHLHRQKNQLEELIRVRLTYIKIRNKTSEKQAALNALDNLGSSLRLMDYEQMKLDNRNHKDKLEERDVELLELRNKAQNAMQILAHRREKAAYVDALITQLNEDLTNVNMDYEEVREQLTYVKRERDLIRNEIDKMKENAGLLNKPRLLRDMENDNAHLKDMMDELDRSKLEFEENAMLLVQLKKCLQSKEILETIKLKHKLKRHDVTLSPSEILLTL